MAINQQQMFIYIILLLLVLFLLIPHMRKRTLVVPSHESFCMHLLLVRLLTWLLVCLHILEGDRNNLRWIMAILCIHDQPAESSFPVNA